MSLWFPKKKWRIEAYMYVPEEEPTIYADREEAMKEKRQLELMQPENLYVVVEAD